MMRDELCQEIRRRTPLHADDLIEKIDAYAAAAERDEVERSHVSNHWDGFDAALSAVEEGQQLYGTTKKAVAALRVASKLGRSISEQDMTMVPEVSEDSA